MICAELMCLLIVHWVTVSGCDLDALYGIIQWSVLSSPMYALSTITVQLSALTSGSFNLKSFRSFVRNSAYLVIIVLHTAKSFLLPGNTSDINTTAPFSKCPYSRL